MGANQDYKVERKRYFFQTGEPFDILYVRCQHCREYIALDMNVLSLIPGFISAVRFLFEHVKCQNPIQQRLKHYAKRVPLETVGNRFPLELPSLPSYEEAHKRQEASGDADIPAAV